MKTFQAFTLAGGLLMIFGVYALVPSSPLAVTHDGTLAVGANEYLYDKFNVIRYGHLAGQFSELEEQPLRVFVFTDSQYAIFVSQYVPQGMFSAEGASGSFSVSLPSPGNYYLVFVHGTGLENSAQDLSFSANLDGYNPVILVVGFGLLAAGAVSFVLGYRLRNKYLDEKLNSRAPDVILFDKPSP
jgi:hypothetical protein